MRRHALLPLLVCLSSSGTALAAPLYQVTDEKGNVTYTDKPPADGAAVSSKPIEQKSLNVLESQPNQDFQKSFEANRAKARETREAAWETYDRNLYDAKQQLKNAQAALKEGEAIKDGDMIATHNPNGGSFMRPSEEYIARQEALKQAVDAAQTRLNAVLKSKPALYRN